MHFVTSACKLRAYILVSLANVSDDICSDSVSLMCFCGDRVTNRAVPGSVLIHCDTVRTGRISAGQRQSLTNSQ